MPHFFINSKDVKDGLVVLNDKDTVSHLFSSLRVKKGENLKFIDETQTQYETTVFDINKKEVRAKINDTYLSVRKLNFELSLVQCVLKPDAQNLLISNATQCGVGAIYPVLSDNCAVSKKTLDAKVQKWEKIAYEAAKQCERADLPKVFDAGQLKEVLAKFKKENILIYAEKYTNCRLDEAPADVDKNLPIAVVTGPEGGFSDEEFKYFIDNGYKLISLGALIFKAPNAVVAGISNIVTRLNP